MKNLYRKDELLSQNEEVEFTPVEMCRSLTDADTSDKPAS